MITKILLTLLVIAITFALIQRQRSRPDKKSEEKQQPYEPVFEKSDLRTGAYMFIAMMFMIGAYLYYQRWQEDHQLLTVKLYRSEDKAPVEYQVFRYQLDNRSFITIDGIRVKIADNERMEILGLDQD